MGIHVMNGGILTTVQDGGRYGYARYGLCAGGAVDPFSFRLANILVGNPMEEAALEVTLSGFSCYFTSDGTVAVTGGDLMPTLNGIPCPMYRAQIVHRGDELSFTGVKTGCRAYLAVAGGLDVPVIMGSRSTYLKASLGGYQGRKLRTGDEIAFRKENCVPENLSLRVLESTAFSDSCTLRVLPGPQADRFTKEGVETFFKTEYTVSSSFDRMGCRLTGEKIRHTTDSNIISDGIVPGSVQVPDSGEPMVMLADCQTTGGYTKIATVISADLHLIAQCRPGCRVRFALTDMETAQDALIARRRYLRQMEADFASGNAPKKTIYKLYDGCDFSDVTVELIEE